MSKSKTEQQTAQDTEQAEVSVESLQEQLSKLEENLKLEKARTANAVYEAEKTKERLEREADTAKKLCFRKVC